MRTILILALSIIGFACADEIVTLSNGLKARLKDNKTWELVKPDSNLVKAKAVDTARFNELIAYTYDKFQDYKAFTNKSPYKSKGATISMHVVCSEKVKCTGRLNITSTSAEWEYLEYHDLAGICDGERVRFGETTHDGTVGEGYVLEFMWTTLEAGKLTKLGNCKELDLRLGTTEFSIPYSDRESWRLLGQMFDK